MSPREIVRVAEEGNTSEPHHRDASQLEDQNPHHAKHYAKENVAPDQEIAQLARHQTKPRDDRLRPASPDPRFQREIENPHHSRDKQRSRDRNEARAETYQAWYQISA